MASNTDVDTRVAELLVQIQLERSARKHSDRQLEPERARVEQERQRAEEAGAMTKPQPLHTFL